MRTQNVLTMAVIFILTILLSSCAQNNVPQDETPHVLDNGNGTVEQHDDGNISIDEYHVRQGTQISLGDLHIGIISVASDAASLAILLDSGEKKTVTLHVGEETTIGSYHIKNTGTWVDKLVSPLTPAGGDSSYVKLKVSSVEGNSSK